MAPTAFPPTHAWLPLAALAAALAAACWSDCRHRIIPNWVHFGVIAGFVAARALDPEARLLTQDTLGHLLIGASLFGLGAALFARGLMGGGDVKLLGALGVWAGPSDALPFLMATALFGGALALVYLALRLAARARPGRRFAEPSLPYGVALSAGGLWVAAGPAFGG